MVSNSPTPSARSEEHTSELQSHSEISYAVFCLKKKNKQHALAFQRGVQLPGRSPNDLRRLSVGRRCLSLTDRRFTFFFFFNDTATTEIYTNLNTLSLHDALPI